MRIFFSFSMLLLFLSPKSLSFLSLITNIVFLAILSLNTAETAQTFLLFKSIGRGSLKIIQAYLC
jgi:hypothetical protein